MIDNSEEEDFIARADQIQAEAFDIIRNAESWIVFAANGGMLATVAHVIDAQRTQILEIIVSYLNRIIPMLGHPSENIPDKENLRENFLSGIPPEDM